MKTLNKIGLDETSTQVLAEKLNTLLSNYQVFYMNVRGFHWNIQGEKFFELHIKFEELYNDLHLKIDELAERILTLGYQPLHNYGTYLKQSTITEAVNVSDGKAAANEVLKALSTILPLQREVLELASNSNDEGTNSLMSDYIRQQEKLVWMYTAYLK